MTDITAGQTAGGFRLPGIGSLGDLAKRGDLALAIGVLTILMVLLLPLPPLLLDFFLATSIIFSVLILMTALFIHTPLEFSSFPTVLLISTMLRLALNLASTRLILARGHEGTAAAGHVIEAFGNFVMSGNFVIGIIVFTILVIVNFVVITKGSGRIAGQPRRGAAETTSGLPHGARHVGRRDDRHVALARHSDAAVHRARRRRRRTRLSDREAHAPCACGRSRQSDSRRQGRAHRGA